MSILYIIANFIYELSLYCLVIGSYNDINNSILGIIALLYFLSLFFTAIPSALHMFGIEVGERFTKIEGLLKVVQVFIVFVLIPNIGYINLRFTIFLLIGVSFTNLFVRIRTSIDLKRSKLVLSNMHQIVLNDINKNARKNEIRNDALRTIIPFFILGISNDQSTVGTASIVLIISFIEFIMIKKIFSKLHKYGLNPDSEIKLISGSIFRAIMLMVFLYFTLMFDKSNFLKYFIASAFCLIFVKLVDKTDINEF